MDRDLESYSHEGNPLLHWREHASLLRTTFNIVAVQISKYLPLSIKNRLLSVLGADIGESCGIALGVQIDIFFPELIKIEDSATIGYGTTILTHETTSDEFRKGEVRIGEEALIGANSTVLPGVEIGKGAKVAARSVVTKDVEPGEFVAGIPAQPVD